MPKITGGSLEEHRQRTRERIFTAFEQLLAERGYDSISLADIASEAAIGRTVMYNYYRDKESLLLDLAGSETDEYLTRLQAELARARDPIEQLRVFIGMQLRQLATQHIALSALRSVLTEAGARRMHEHVEPLSRTLRDILVRAQFAGLLPPGDVDVLLPLVGAVISGRSTVDLDGAELDEAIEATTTFVLRALGAGERTDEPSLGSTELPSPRQHESEVTIS
jgi:AcrR family transcriptional regulator